MPSRVIRTFPSRSGRSQGHEVYEDGEGVLWCTCPAGQHGHQCWALNIVESDRYLEAVKSAIRQDQMGGEKLPRWEDIRQEFDENQERVARERRFWDRMFELYQAERQ